MFNIKMEEWYPGDKYTAASEWLYDWQGLIGGLLALAAAGLSVFYLRQQIDQANRHENNRLARRLAAARGMMPSALSGFIDHIEQCCALLKVARRASPAQLIAIGFPQGEFDLAPLSKEIADDFCRFMEAEQPDMVEYVSSMLRANQVLYVRTVSLVRSIRNMTIIPYKPDIKNYIVDASLLYAKALALFAPIEARLSDPPADWFVVSQFQVALGPTGLQLDEGADSDIYAAVDTLRLKMLGIERASEEQYTNP